MAFVYAVQSKQLTVQTGSSQSFQCNHYDIPVLNLYIAISRRSVRAILEEIDFIYVALFTVSKV